MQLDFRKVGFTADAINYPLSEGGKEIVALHNGVGVATMPAEFSYAPNLYMQRWMDALGARLEVGLAVKHDSGRWLQPSEIGL